LFLHHWVHGGTGRLQWKVLIREKSALFDSGHIGQINRVRLTQGMIFRPGYPGNPAQNAHGGTFPGVDDKGRTFYEAGFSYCVGIIARTKPSSLILARTRDTGVQSGFTLFIARFERLLGIIGNPLILRNHVLGSLPDFVRSFRHALHLVGLVLGLDGEFVSITSSLDDFIERAKANESHDDREHCDPHGCFGCNPRRLVYGILMFLLGFALMKFAFYIVDEPNPPIIFRLGSFGIGVLSCACIFQSLNLILGISVTQKHLTPNHLCNTVMDMANVLNTDKQIAVIGALAEGSSIRSIERITGVHRDTIMRLGVKVGKGCGMLLDSKMQDLGCRYLQFDEVWGFIGKKERHMRIGDDPEMGDVWTYCAIDAETKLVPTFKVGKRNLATTTEFVQDVASRMRNRVQISTDALHGYIEAVERSFGADVDYGQIVKVYTHDAAQHPERKYSAPSFTSAMRRPITGSPDVELVSTSYVERLNATTRLHIKRLSRLTLAFSKKLENFEAAVALHFAYYNLVKRHGTLRCTPAMAAGIDRDFWTVGDLVEAAS
jgi:IS1 family transposase